MTLGRVGAHDGCAMLQTDQFWQYAKEAILSASYAKAHDERLGLLDLARIWTQAAMIERHAQADTAIAASVDCCCDPLPVANTRSSAYIETITGCDLRSGVGG